MLVHDSTILETRLVLSEVLTVCAVRQLDRKAQI